MEADAGEPSPPLTFRESGARPHPLHRPQPPPRARSPGQLWGLQGGCELRSCPARAAWWRLVRHGLGGVGGEGPRKARPTSGPALRVPEPCRARDQGPAKLLFPRQSLCRRLPGWEVVSMTPGVLSWRPPPVSPTWKELV